MAFELTVPAAKWFLKQNPDTGLASAEEAIYWFCENDDLHDFSEEDIDWLARIVKEWGSSGFFRGECAVRAIKKHVAATQS